MVRELDGNAVAISCARPTHVAILDASVNRAPMISTLAALVRS